MASPTPLPIDACLDQLTAALRANMAAVLAAPPGAGKTTRVPLVLAQEPWAQAGKIVVLEPRRLAARAAAARLAATLGQEIGRSIGLRARLQSRTGPENRIEVVTEGVFTRMILDDPMLEGVAAVVFDEFHERSLDADLGLALALEAQRALRPDLRLLVMSATLDTARIAALLGGAPVVESAGAAYPVETIYGGRAPGQRIEEAVTAAVIRALRAEPGSILAFLPGQGEIVRTAAMLADRIDDPTVDIAPLYGALDRSAQDRAILPAPPGRRKIVLATSIAETSITIEGVRVVVDSGLARVPRFEPDIGITRLETVRVSRAAADQRRGRAGRTAPGVCCRLWEQAATGALEPFDTPEILAADLSALMLDLAQWGARDPAALDWLDPPPAPACAEARNLLRELGALDADGAITPAGRAMRRLPLPPRLARMVIRAARWGAQRLAADLAAVLSERGLGGDSPDLAERVERFRNDGSARARDMRRLADNWARQAQAGAVELDDAAPTGAPANLSGDLPGQIQAGALIALAYPDRIARARGAPGAFLMANGRAARCEPHELLAKSPFLAIAEIAGRADSARILAAAPLAAGDIETIAGDRIESREETAFERASGSVRRKRTRRLGAIALNEQPLPVGGADAAVILAEGAAALGIDRLPWTSAQRQLRDRVRYARDAGASGSWPDLSDEALAASAAAWLAPFIEGKSSIQQIAPADLDRALAALLPWPLPQELDEQAPSHYLTPAGSRIAIDYGADGSPLVSVRVQELFGLTQHPAIAGGRIALTLELLSPARRPIQITRDLPGFWRGSWAAVKAEMRGRYPKHPWPDDPARAPATTRVKPRGA